VEKVCRFLWDFDDFLPTGFEVLVAHYLVEEREWKKQWKEMFSLLVALSMRTKGKKDENRIEIYLQKNTRQRRVLNHESRLPNRPLRTALVV
jgi:hypothetical protein